MQKEEFYFDSRDGKNKIHAVRYMPEPQVKVRAVVQIVHGMAEYFERYEPFAQFLTERGIVVTGEDHLGHGKTVTDGKYGYFCENDPATVVVRDVHRLKKMTQELYPDVPIVIMGHSMGSFITRNYICHYGKGVRAAIIMGTGMNPKMMIEFGKLVADVQKVFLGAEKTGKMLDKIAFGVYNDKIPNRRTNFDWLSRDNAMVDAYIADPLCGFTFTVNGFQTLFELCLRLHQKERVAKTPSKLPILMVSGDADPVGDYGKGVKLAEQSLHAAGVKDISHRLYPGARHELLNETNRAEVMQDIYTWLEKKVLQ